MAKRKRKASGAATEKKRPIKVREIKRTHAGKVQEPWAILDRLMETVEAFKCLAPAKWVLLWRKDWKPDVDGVATAAQVRKASEIDRTLAGYDLALMLPEKGWTAWDDTEREWRVFHELCHVRPVLDTAGNQVRDEKDRLQWRLRRHPIVAFPEEIERYGLERVVGGPDRLRAAIEEAERPLIAAMEQSAASVTPNPADWRKLPIDKLGLSESALAKLGLSESVLAKCGERDVLTRGDFLEWQAKHGDF